MSTATRLLRKIVFSIVPPRWARTLRRPLLVPRRYKALVAASEKILDMQLSPEQLDDHYWAALLRKYAHMIDKGLQRCDYEPTHSANVYQAAQQALDRMKPEYVSRDPSVRWAIERLKEHEARHLAQPPALVQQPVQKSRCSYDDLLDTIKTRRSIRTYEKRTVTNEVVKKIIEGVNWSPTSCNRQPAQVFASNSPEVARQCLAQCQGATGFGEFTPLFLCFCADPRPYRIPDEIMLPHVDAALGIQNACLLAHALGLSITLLSWAGHSKQAEQALRDLLNIPPYCQIIVNAAGGYPACGAVTPARKPVDVTCHMRTNQHSAPPQQSPARQPLI